MRTCPACGKDTEAEATSSCTECGFSPVSDDDGATWEQSSWEGAADAPADDPVISPWEDPPASVEEAQRKLEESAAATTTPEAASTDYGFPDTPQPPPTARKPGAGRALLVLVIAIGIGIANFSSVLDGCDGIGSKPGPTAEETEAALVSDAALQGGLVGVTAACPDSAEDTEVDATFVCTVTAASGRRQAITVTNLEDSFEWSRQTFFKLQRSP